MPRIVLTTASLFAALAVYAPPSASAQDVSGGIYVGVSLASLVNEDAPSERRVGTRLGGFLDLDVTSLLGARLEGVYVMKGVKSVDSDVTVALDYVEIPLLARISLPGSVAPTLVTGPAFGVKVGAQLQGPFDSFDYGDGVRAFDFGWTIGGGIATAVADRDLLVDVRYTRGLRPVFDFGDPTDLDADDENQAISVGFGLALF